MRWKELPCVEVGFLPAVGCPLSIPTAASGLDAGDLGSVARGPQAGPADSAALRTPRHFSARSLLRASPVGGWLSTG